jgi:predicted nucleic acid-binding protein
LNRGSSNAYGDLSYAGRSPASPPSARGVYSAEEGAAEKGRPERAIELLTTRPEGLVVSTQVLQEFYVVPTRKLKPSPRRSASLRATLRVAVVAIA